MPQKQPPARVAVSFVIFFAPAVTEINSERIKRSNFMPLLYALGRHFAKFGGLIKSDVALLIT
jgi:hypothetical protein